MYIYYLIEGISHLGMTFYHFSPFEVLNWLLSVTEFQFSFSWVVMVPIDNIVEHPIWTILSKFGQGMLQRTTLKYGTNCITFFILIVYHIRQPALGTCLKWDEARKGLSSNMTKAKII